MKTSLSENDLCLYVKRQLDLFFPDSNRINLGHIRDGVKSALPRVEHCFSKVNNKYFIDQNGATCFNHLHADQYSMFLYLLSNSLYHAKSDVQLCSKIFQLNRALHGIDVFYEINLPGVFLFVHPLGTVLGRGEYDDYFLVYQRCNIGSNNDIYPSIGKYVSMHPGASVLGDCRVETNCRIGAGSLLLDQNLPVNSLYIGNPRDHLIKCVDNVPEIWL